MEAREFIHVRLHSVIYTLAEKFLDSIDLEEIMDEISMTRLGQMLVNKGFKNGRAEGRQEALLETARKLLPILDEETIAQTVGLPLETIR